jgi:exopolyphosphatase/guanosine-5'-triphosphate,3'-diphosphate pyrophosphatase
MDDKELFFLDAGAKLLNIGTYLNFYSHRYHSHYLILNNLDYGFTHMEKLIIASIVKYHGKRFNGLDEDEFYGMLKNKEECIKWLSTILSIAEALSIDKCDAKMEFSFERGSIRIKTNKKLYLAEEKLKMLLKGSGLSFTLELV